MAFGTHISGVGGNVTIAGVNLEVTEWSAEESADETDTTNTGNIVGGVSYKTQEFGSRQLTGSMKGFYDSVSPPTINATLRGAITLRRGVGGGAITIPQADISGFSQSSSVSGEVEWTANFKSYGDYTL